MAVARHFILVFVVLLVGAAANAAGVDVARIMTLSVRMADGATRITIESAEPLKVEVFMLRTPDRLVIDFPVVEWPDGATVRLPEDGLVSDLRFGRFDRLTSRLVMDLRQSAELAASDAQALKGSKGYRLQFDLKPTAPGQAPRGKVSVGADDPGAKAALARPDGGTVSSLGTTSDVLEKALAALSLPPSRPDQRVVIAIDAGHGGIDPGAIGTLGTAEKTVTLAAARELRRQLETSGRFSVVMTRVADIYVPLRERVEIARTAGARLFVSLHADQHDSPRLRGASIYTLSETASDAETEAFAHRENNADVVAGVALAEEYDAEVAQILYSLVQQSTMNCSAVFAATLVDEISQHSSMIPKAHRFAGFRVLKAPDVPSVLIELGYLSNREDERLLANGKHRVKLMRAVAQAISTYLDGRTC